MKKLIFLCSFLLSLVACGGGDGAVDNRVDFNEFVIDEINNTEANDVPAGINETDFRFNNEDETAFDSLL